MKVTRITLLIAFAICIAMGAYAEEYPVKPVKVIVPFTAGSATDVVARAVSEKLSEMWGQPVLVENIGGAGGTVGTEAIAKSPADGYTLLISSSSHIVSPSIYATLPYDPVKDFIDIAPLANQPLALFVSATAAQNSISELIAAAKAEPGKIKFGSPGTGSSSHLAAEEFKSISGIDVVHVPYKGGPETIAGTTDGTVTYAMLPIGVTLKGVKAGKLKALGVTSLTRSDMMPDLPTIAESGLPGFESVVWWGVWAPAGIPPFVKERLIEDVAKALASTDLLEKFRKGGYVPMSMSQTEFADFVQKERMSAASTVKEAGIKPK